MKIWLKKIQKKNTSSQKKLNIENKILLNYYLNNKDYKVNLVKNYNMKKLYNSLILIKC